MTPDELLDSLHRVRHGARELEKRWVDELDRLDEPSRVSAVNLLHYLAVRQFDLGAEQDELSRRGLSSLGRSEARVMPSLDAVIERLAADASPRTPPESGQHRLAARADAALGPARHGHLTRLMVTLPSEAAHDRQLVAKLVEAGMSVARINSAHDDPDSWRAMIANVRSVDPTVRVAVDLAGPKLRTGPLGPSVEVRRLKPTRDLLGRVEQPWTVTWSADAGPAGESGPLPVDFSLVAAARAGDEIRLRDTRDRRRRLVVEQVGPDGIEVSGDRTTYLRSHHRIELRREGAVVAAGRIGRLTPVSPSVRVWPGQLIELRREQGHGEVPVIPVDVPEIYRVVEPGQRVLLDDGRIEGRVVSVTDDAIGVELVRGGRIRADKGVNLPDTQLELGGLTPEDRRVLDEIVELVDLVALSFVGGAGDVEELHAELDRRRADQVGVILKIERRQAFDDLPALLMRGLRREPLAIMVARGDLAVEVGYQRLGELQEEILWLCEAAHVPVIWATQVLETLTKTGAPTRAEVTDAAWAARAECVMLNKGPYIPDALLFLDDLLARMNRHQRKRSGVLGPLSVARSLGSVAP